MKIIKEVPAEYNGDFESFYNEFIEPTLPNPESVKAAHIILMNYLNRKDPIFIVRRFEAFQRRGHLFVQNNFKFFTGDNEPALWFYAKACNNLLTINMEMENFIADQSFPIGFSTDSKKNEDKSEWKNWKKEKWEKGFSDSGWFHAHLFDAADGISPAMTAENLRMRMLRYLHPANHFPMPSHYNEKFKSRLDSKDMSEQKGIKAFIIGKYKERYGEIWDEFISIANLNQHEYPIVFDVQISFKKSYHDLIDKIDNRNSVIQLSNNLTRNDKLNVSDKTRLIFKKKEIDNLFEDPIVFKIKSAGTKSDPRIIDLVFSCTKVDLKNLFNLEGKDWQLKGEYSWSNFPQKAEKYIISGVLGNKVFNNKKAA